MATIDFLSCVGRNSVFSVVYATGGLSDGNQHV